MRHGRGAYSVPSRADGELACIFLMAFLQADVEIGSCRPPWCSVGTGGKSYVLVPFDVHEEEEVAQQLQSKNSPAGPKSTIILFRGEARSISPIYG